MAAGDAYHARIVILTSSPLGNGAYRRSVAGTNGNPLRPPIGKLWRYSRTGSSYGIASPSAVRSVVLFGLSASVG